MVSNYRHHLPHLKLNLKLGGTSYENMGGMGQAEWSLGSLSYQSKKKRCETVGYICMHAKKETRDGILTTRKKGKFRRTQRTENQTGGAQGDKKKETKKRGEKEK